MSEGRHSEIEITPEMIEAGLREYGYFEQGADSPTELIERVFRAMLEARYSALRLGNFPPTTISASKR